MTNKSTLAQGLSHAWPWTKPIGSSPTTSRLLRYSLLCMLVLLCGGSAWADDATLAVDFEEETTSYTDWTFTNFATKQTNSGVPAHGGSYFGSTNSKTSGSLVTKEKLAKPKNIQFYISKTSTNNSASSWIIKVSTDGETWTDVKTQSASADITKGTWTEVTQDLTSYTNVYVGIFYDGTTAIRTIDDVTLTYENVNDTRTATTIAFAEGYATTGTEGGTIDLPTATVMAGETAVTGAEVTWKSSDESVVKIEGNKISLLTPGTATITATYAGDDSYKSSEASYGLTVTELSVDGLASMAIIFKDSGNNSDSNTKITSIDDIISEGKDYVSAIPTATNVYNGRTGRGLKLGASSKSATLKLTLAKAVKPIKITFDAMQYSDTETSITVNGKTITNLGSKLATYSVIYDENTEVSEITISTPEKRAYITNVKIYYEGVVDNRTATTMAFAEGYTTSGTAGQAIDLPTATVMAGEASVEGATVTWTSSDETVATIGDGVINLLKAGTTTIKASYAGDDTYKASDKSFILTVSDAPYTSLQALQAAVTDASTPANISLSNVQVVFVNGSNAYLTDADGYGALIYTNGHGLEVGQVLNGTISCKFILYQGNTEITNFSKEGLTITTADVTPIEKTLPLTSANQSTLVTLKGLTYNADAKTLSDGTNTITFYDKFKTNVTLEDGKTYDVTGIVVMYNTTNNSTIEICPRTADDVTEYVAPTPDPFYILGVEGWELPADMKEMTWNAESQAYEYPLSNTSTAYFCFADGGTDVTAGDWTTFNSTYRWSATPAGEENNVVVTLTEGSYQKQLEKGIDKSFELAPGQYVISVTTDKLLTITGEATPAEDTYVVAGGIKDSDPEDPGFFVTWWAGEDEANQMDKQQDGTYSITYENVEVAAGTTYEFKFVKNGETWIPDGINNNLWCYFEEAGTYNVTFTYNPNGETPSGNSNVTVTKVEDTDPEFRDIKANLTMLQELALGTDVYITVAEDGTIGKTDDPLKSAATLRGGWHGTSYGWTNFQATVPVEGCVKITYATHDYGDVVTVTNTEGQEVAKFNTTGPKWSDDNSNVVVAYYRTDEPTALTFSQVRYNPYFAVEKIDPKDIPAEVTNYNISFVAGEDVEGVVPAAVEVEAGSKITAPANYTLYKDGSTLTGWTDGETTYAPGDEITPAADMQLTAVFTENTVSLADRTEAVTVTFALDGSKAQYGFQGGTGIIVTQTTVNGETIDVKAATSGKFAYNGGGWHQMNNGSLVAVPSCKDATIVVNGYQTGYTINANNTAMTGNADNSYTYTATTDNAIVEIAATADNTYINNIVITLPKVESTEPGGDDISGVFFSADVIATEAITVTKYTTKEVDASIATVTGGKITIVNNNKDDKKLIDIQSNQGAFAFTNGDTFLKIELDQAIAVGDEINAISYWNRSDTELLGIWLSTATTRPGSCTVSLTSDTKGWAALPTYIVKDGDDIVGAKTIYVYRATGKSTYIDNITITRPADEPVAEDVTAMWDFEHNCANLASKNDGGAYTETTMASNVEGVSMTIAYNGGQIKNNDNSYQVTNGVVMQIPVKNAGDKVTVVGYPGYFSYSVGGIDATEQTTTHKATADEAAQGYVAVASTDNNNYINSITVTQYAPKPVGLKEKAIIDTDFQDWAKSSTTTEVTTKYTKENITFTYTNATVDSEATNEGKFPTSTDAAYKGYIMSAKSEATITTTQFASISKIRYRHGATGSNRGWGLKMKVGEGEWETVSETTVGSTPAWIEKTIDKEKVQLQWYNLNTAENAYMFELEVYAKVDLSNSPLLATLKANGTTYTAEDIFEMGTDDNYAATIELASSEAMPSAENPVEAVADNGEIGNITYDTSNDQSIVTIPVTAGEASVNYVATFVRKPKFTLTYYNLDGEEIGTQQVEKDAKIGEFAYNIADVQAKTDGYKARGWFKNNYVGEKWTTESVITENVNLYAVETEIEVSSDNRTYRFDLTDKNFDANDHEAFNPIGNGKYHNEHGWIFGNGDKIELLVGKKATISIGLCQYSAAGSTISASNDKSIEAVAETCGSTGAIEYEGEAGTLTLTINTINSTEGSVYIHSIKIMNTTTTNYEVNGDWIIVKEGDASSLVDAIEAAKEGARIFLPNGTYDLGQKTKTTIGSNNVSLIGESMEGVIIKNTPTTEGIDVTATLLNTSSNLYMQDLTIECNAPWIGNAERGVTLQDKGNQTILKNVYLKGLQDTYYSNNNSGTYYFEDGKVEGSVDYVCGNGDVYFNKTSFYTVNKSTGGKGGCIAAPNTTTTDKKFGYIFNKCTLDGVENEDGQYRLGRPWADNTQCLYLNTTMNIQPRTEGWGEWSDDVSKQHSVTRYAEYNSIDADGNTISLTGRKTSFKGVANNPVLTEDEAAAYTPEAIFNGDWRPQDIAKQVTAPKAKLSNDGKKITWTPANDGATAYAIFKDGKFLGITTESSWTIEEVAPAPRRAEEPEKTGYTIRAANSRGGFGPAAEVSPATGIAAIEAELGGDVKIYDLNGRRVMTPTKGVYIINGKKVVIK